VLDGEADAGATYLSLDPSTGRPLSAGWLEAGAAINGAFIVATAGPIPSDAIVFASPVDAELRAAIVEQLMGLPSSAPKAMRFLFGADGFAPPPAAHFEACGRSSRSARRGAQGPRTRRRRGGIPGAHGGRMPGMAYALPILTEHQLLPVGVHDLTLDEIEACSRNFSGPSGAACCSRSSWNT